MMKVGYVSKEQFEKTPELKAQYGSYENFMRAQLGTQSTFTFAKENPNYTFNSAEAFLNMRIQAQTEHNKKSQELIENYQLLEAKYKALLGQQTSLNNALFSKYGVSSNNDLLSAMNDKNAFFDQGLYRRSANSVNGVYNEFIAALQTANYQTHRLV